MGTFMNIFGFLKKSNKKRIYKIQEMPINDFKEVYPNDKLMFIGCLKTIPDSLNEFGSAFCLKDDIYQYMYIYIGEDTLIKLLP